MASTNYEHDFYAWTQEQAELLRSGKHSALDIENLVEEIESMGRREKHELISRLAVLIAHLLKWQYQKALRSRSWTLTIREQRDEIIEHLEENPSLIPKLEAGLKKSYRRALLKAEKETGIGSFPEECPYSLNQILDAEFFPK